MWATITAVGFSVAALGVYFKGAKPGKPWGKPVLALLVIAAVISVVLPRTELTLARHETHEAVTMLGDAMREDLSPGAEVLFVRYQIDPEMMMVEMEEYEDEGEWTKEEIIGQQLGEVESAFERGLGYSVEIIGYDPPSLTDSYEASARDAEAFNKVLKKYADQNVRACISMAGLPRDKEGEVQVDDLMFDQMPSNMLFVADLGFRYEPDEVEKWINDGVLDAVVLHPSIGRVDRVVITSDNLEELPAESPMSR
ncbi:MAG: hypothetical protein ACOC0A_04690 [Planctomycetota bacterium]